MSKVERLPLSKQIAYAIGQLGWATLISMVNLTLVYFYIPPAEADLPVFVTQAPFFVVLNVITLLAASGRIFDAVTDPIIASLSDRSTNPRGRRIPFLLYGSVPATVFCVLMFFPITNEESVLNILWLGGTQFLFFLFITVYVTPFFALIAELGHTPKERLDLSTYISVTYALGIVIASQIPGIAGLVGGILELNALQSLQAATIIIGIVACLLMFVPVIFIDEKRYCESVPSNIPVMESLKTCLKNRNFIPYVASDLVYFMGLTLIQTGMLYYITVLLRLGEEWFQLAMTLVVLSSFLFYPAVNLLAKKAGKKKVVLFAFVWFAGVFLTVFFLGRMPIPSEAQALAVAGLAAMPMAFLGVLPNAILADIAEHDALRTGVRKEGMYYRARTFLQKIGVTGGIVVFAGLTNFGKDVATELAPWADLGIPLSGVAGCVLCLGAFLVFLRYNEKQVLEEIASMEAARAGGTA